jgi:hypothetical protein
VHGLPGRNSSGHQRLLDPVQLVQLALQQGAARRSLSPGHHAAVFLEKSGGIEGDANRVQ